MHTCVPYSQILCSNTANQATTGAPYDVPMVQSARSAAQSHPLYETIIDDSEFGPSSDTITDPNSPYYYVVPNDPSHKVPMASRTVCGVSTESSVDMPTSSNVAYGVTAKSSSDAHMTSNTAYGVLNML